MAPTFASAAASGSNPNSSRADGASEWTRRANGATQTFRRTSQATTASSATSANSSSTPQPSASTPREGPATSTHQPRNSSESSGGGAGGVYVPPHVNANRNGAAAAVAMASSGGGGEMRYSKDRVLDIFRAEHEAGSLLEGLASLYVGTFQPSASNGVSSSSGAAVPAWGRRDEQQQHKGDSANHNVDLCWDRNAHMFPMALHDYTDEERDIFNGSVNSPIKPPTLTNKEGTPKDATRKTSISQSLNSPGAFGLTSPTQARPGNRRRDTSEAYPFPNTSLASPSSSRFAREETGAANPPAALLRRRTEQQKDAQAGSGEERDRDKNEPPSAGLKRTTTGGLGTASSASSNWPSSSASAFSPMGSFGNFAIGGGAGPTPTAEKRPGYGSVRGQSRFAGLMKDSSVDLKEKTSSGDLGEQERNWMEQRHHRGYGEEADPYQEDDVPSGSAALGGGLDDSPPKQRGFGAFGGSHRVPDDGGFSALGMTSDTVGYHDFSHQTPQHRQHGDHMHEPMSPTNTNPYQSPENERTEVDELNDPHDMHSGPLPGLGGFRANQGQGLPGLGSNFPALGGRMPTSYEAAASDRSQTSSTGPSRGFPSLSGLGGLPGLGGGPSPWSAGPQGIGTPTRDRAAGLGGAFGEGADMQSPVLAGLGGGGSNAFGPGAGGFGSVRSKMGSLFPSAMQEQMRMGEGGMPGDEQGFDPFARQHSGIGALSRGPLSAGPARDAESPFRNNNRGMFDDLLDQTPRNEMPSAIGEPSGMFGPMGSGGGGSSQTPLSSVPSQDPLGLARKSQSNLQRQPSNLASPSSASQPPLQQMRTMVMPDRMRWIYKDPQGSTQGPWSGLEMHDWYRAGFFTPELLIKRVEDPEFEPLAQLIRRIGNSREPFLVPQIGVPHEAASAVSAAALAGGKPPPNPGNAAAANAGVQPPFPNSFPSFGTTLTAEQQNALERRKQEEQFLMARQKEHLAQQQLYIKQQHQSIGMSGIGSASGGQLHHHSSAHSLHSQPSFGSVTSPAGGAAYQPSPTQGPMTGGPAVPGFFDNTFRQAQGQQGGPEMLGSIREGDMAGMMERLNLAANNNNRGGPPQQQLPLGQGLPDDVHAAQIAAMLQDRARLQREQAEHDHDHRGSGPEGDEEDEREARDARDRFHQFRELRQRREEEHDDDEAEDDLRSAARDRQMRELELAAQRMQDEHPQEETLTQQVQAASAAKQASAQQQAAASPWGKIDTAHANAAQQERTTHSASPMPAPIAQRKHNVADNLVAETRSGTQSPAVDTPTTSVAPWANQAAEGGTKTLSLKEIQEAEAKRAAKQEALAAAERRAAYERELAAAQAAASIAPAPGLPTGATWATQSPATSTGSGPSSSVWGAKTAAKPTVGKTLQQIQKEEEAKKQRAALAAAANAAATATAIGVPTGPAVAPSAPSAGGKRYADLAGKTASPASPAPPAAGWSTVGAGGKVKATASTATSPAVGVPPVRAVSGGVATLAGSAKPSPVLGRSTTMGTQQMHKLTKADALGEFKKWALLELQRGGLHNGINASDFIETLLAIGSELDIITEAVHGSAQTIDSRHFAEEFVRRKKQADKGVVEPSLTASPGAVKANDNAWSAVAKKGQTPAGASAVAPAPAATGDFKVAKAKGRRK